MPKRNSRVNSEYQFDHEVWVVSLINQDKSLKGKFSGHSVLIVEGIKRIPGAQTDMFNETLFVGQYDARVSPTEYDPSTVSSLKNEKGIIHRISVREDSEYTHPSGDKFYGKGKSWLKARENVEHMIAMIKADQERAAKSLRGEAEPIKYQAYGSRGGLLQWLFSDSEDDPTEDAINCAQWCINKLQDAGVIHDVKPKPENAAGGCNVL